MQNTKERIIELLRDTQRDGIEKLISWLEDEGFFESPASTRFHGAYRGGLATHSLRVYEMLHEKCTQLDLDAVLVAGQKPLAIGVPNIIIAALLHDVCKVGAYSGDQEPYKWNKAQPKGHALLSLERIKKFITLAPIEEMMIRFHMGVYGCKEFYKPDDWQQGEYPLRGDHSKDDELSKEESQKVRYGQSLTNAWYHNPVVKLMYFCDELATLEEKNKGENHG